MTDWVRNREQAVGIAAIAVVSGAAIAISGVRFWLRSGDAFSGLLSIGLAAGLVWFLVARCALAGAQPTGEGLLVRNPLHSRLVPWSAIERVYVGSHGVWPRVAVIELEDGSQIHIWGLQGPLPFLRPNSQGKLRTQVHELNRIAFEARNGTRRRGD